MGLHFEANILILYFMGFVFPHKPYQGGPEFLPQMILNEKVDLKS